MGVEFLNEQKKTREHHNLHVKTSLRMFDRFVCIPFAAAAAAAARGFGAARSPHQETDAKSDRLATKKNWRYT